MMELCIKKTMEEKLKILADAAKYDVACTSSGVDRKGKEGHLGNSRGCGICHSFAADGRCISLLKILMTNHCIFDCKYCISRCSNDIPRAIFTPEELCQLTIEFYKRNYIEGLFLSSGIIKSPAYTMELICETLFLLRSKYHFRGYIHVKSIPGAPDHLLSMAGYLADRMSINLELPTETGLRQLAPHKSMKGILQAMGKVSNTIAETRLLIGKDRKMERSYTSQHLKKTIFSEQTGKIEHTETGLVEQAGVLTDVEARYKFHSVFSPAGQSTQMIIGATKENDYTLIRATQKLYQTQDLKRVFYSAYIPINEDPALPNLETPPPLLREHRLYQADWLMRFYGFYAEELLTPERPNFHEQLDPKCFWALQHLDEFPVEVQTASFDQLLRVPGIGPKSVKRIVAARKYGSLSFETLKKMGVVLKRAHYFITCGGKMLYKIPIEASFITNQMIALNQKENWQITYKEEGRQMSLFDDFHLQGGTAFHS